MTQYITSPRGKQITVDEFYAMTGMQQYCFLGSDNQRKALAKHNESRKKRIMTPRGVFKGITETRKAYGYKCNVSVYKMIKSVNPKYRNWYYVDQGPKKVDKNFATFKQNKAKTMMQRYGKLAIKPPKYTFDGLSQRDFMKANKSLIMSLVDTSHRHKYHKIHQLLKERCDGKLPHHSRRSVCICDFMKKEA